MSILDLFIKQKIKKEKNKFEKFGKWADLLKKYDFEGEMRIDINSLNPENCVFFLYSYLSLRGSEKFEQYKEDNLQNFLKNVEDVDEKKNYFVLDMGIGYCRWKIVHLSFLKGAAESNKIKKELLKWKPELENLFDPDNPIIFSTPLQNITSMDPEDYIILDREDSDEYNYLISIKNTTNSTVQDKIDDYFSYLIRIENFLEKLHRNKNYIILLKERECDVFTTYTYERIEYLLNRERRNIKKFVKCIIEFQEEDRKKEKKEMKRKILMKMEILKEIEDEDKS